MKENKQQSAALATILKVITVLTHPLLRYPEDLKVEGREYPDCILISVRSRGVDYGQLVGRGGETVRALQEILGAIGERTGHTVKLSVAVPKIGDRNDLPAFKPAEKWSNAAVKEIAGIVGYALFGACVTQVEDFNDNTIVTFALNGRYESNESGLTGWTVDSEQNVKQMRLNWPGEELNHVFHAIGKAMGRNEIIVQLNQEETK